MAVRSLLLGLAFAVLAGCASLTAEAPLFSPSDENGPPPLTEGIWINVGDEDCPASYARRQRGRFPADCGPIEIRRRTDGGWRAQFRVDLVSNPDQEDLSPLSGPMSMTIAPVTALSSPESYASLYLIEYIATDPDTDERQAPAYAVFAPVGALPATQIFLVAQLGCIEILRDGPIEGVEVQYQTREEPAPIPGEPQVPPTVSDGPPTIVGCVATTKAAVREAARRSMIENLSHLDDGRLVYVRPN